MNPVASFEKLENDLRLLMRAFRRVLGDVGDAAVGEHLPWRGLWAPFEASRALGANANTSFPEGLGEQCVQAHSIAFMLLNGAEENSMAQLRRAAEDARRLGDDAGSWDQMIARARAAGADQQALAEQLARLRVEPVFTAHPTEAKRQTVLEHHRQLYRVLVELENTMWTRSEREAIEHEVEVSLERLWRTGEIYLEKPSLADERRGVLHYLRHVLPDVIPWYARRLRAAWARAGFDGDLLSHPEALPRVTFGNWVGGDRDGHPGVTADITAETLQLFRREALELVDTWLARAAVGLSLASMRHTVPTALQLRIGALTDQLGDAGRSAVARNRGEPWRQFVNLVREALPMEGRPPACCLRDASELLSDLGLLRASLIEIGAQRLAASDVDPLISLVRAFGFHLARVDVRQNSAFHDRALAQLLEIAGVADAATYPEWGTERRRTLLDAELVTRRPLAAAGDVEGLESRAVLDVYRELASHRARFGDAGLGSLIVSMTRSVEDLLGVYVLAGEAGLLDRDADGQRFCPLEVVPLFETIDDLERAPALLDDYLSHPVVQASLRYRQRTEGLAEPVQQVMIGYSDSSKDGGIVRSFWSLYRGQSQLAEAGRRHGVRVRFFHGRGGTIGRGASPTHRFVKALPVGTIGGDLRLTEQGETIAQRYANRVTAAHHLELLSAGTLMVAASDGQGRQEPPELMAIMDQVAESSHRAYRELLETEGFVTFFGQATPLDVIEASRIGSRPARRSGKRTLSDLRAIPWVFAWNQSRFVLPGWYGIGTALTELRSRDEAAFRRFAEAKSEASRWDPIHLLVSNAATAFMTSDLDVMRLYADLVEDPALRERILGRIVEEHARTAQVFEWIYGAPLPVSRRRVHHLIQLRSSALDKLHLHQVDLLRRWRAGGNGGDDTVLRELLLTVNAIAAGLGATG